MFLFSLSHSYAQVDLSKYYNPKFSILNLYDFQKVAVTWNMPGNIQKHLNQALNTLDEKNPQVALASLEEAIKLDSTSWICYYYRGVCKKQVLKLDDAEQDFLKTISLNPTLAEAHIELGETYLAKGLNEKATDQFNEAIRKNPGIAESYLNLGNLALIERKDAQAMKMYKKCIDVNPSFSMAYLMQGLVNLLVYYKTSNAVRLFDKAIALDPGFTLAYYWKGITHLRMGNPELCLSAWSNVIQLNPENAFLILMRGYLYIELGDYEKAFIDFKNSITVPQHNLLKTRAEQTLLNQETDLQVAADYLVANGYGLNDTAFTYLKKGFCLLVSGKVLPAFDNIELAEETEHSAVVFLLKAMVHDRRNEFVEARKYYDLALSIDREIFYAHQRKAAICVELRQWNEAQDEINQMFRIRPEAPIAYRYRGAIDFLQGRYESAVTNFNVYLKVDSLNADLLVSRAACFENLGKRKEALVDLLKLAPEQPENWGLQEQVAKNYLILGDTTSAVTFLNTYTASNPTTVRGELKKLEILIHQKKWDESNALVMVIEAKPMPSGNRSFHLPNFNFLKGQIAFHQKDFKKATELFTQTMIYEPSMDAVYHRAKSYIAQHDFENAIEDLKRLRTSGFRDSESLYNFCMMRFLKTWEIVEKTVSDCLTQGDTTKALKLLDEHITEDPEVHWRLKKLEIHVAQKNWKDATKQVKIIEQTREASPFIALEISKLTFLKGMMAFSNNDFLSAIDLFTQSLDRLETEDARYHRAKSFIAINQFKRAFEDLKKLKNSGFKDSEYLYNLMMNKPFKIWEGDEKVAEDYLAQGDTTKALEIFNKHSNDIIVAALKKLEILVAQKKWDEAKDEVKRIEASSMVSDNIAVDGSKLHFLKGLIAYHQADFKTAIEFFTSALYQQYGSMDSQYYRAKCFIALKEFQRAIVDLNNLKNKNFKDSRALYNSLVEQTQKNK